MQKNDNIVISMLKTPQNMIIGIGTDIVQVERISKSISKEGFKHKVFSDAEIAYCESKANKAEHYAARFAAKEAFVKALGTGFVEGMAFKEVSVVNDELGKPSIQLTGNTALIIAAKQISSIQLSLSHVKELAIAMVVIQ
jgi:holo-[acyl-carrier protein] synthase